MKQRDRFSRNCIASSRGSYVRKAHYEYVQQQLAQRGIHASIKEIIEVSITIKAQRYYVKCFGKLKQITEHDAMMLESELVIIM